MRAVTTTPPCMNDRILIFKPKSFRTCSAEHIRCRTRRIPAKWLRPSNSQGLYISYPGEWDLMTVATGTTAPTFLPADDGNVYGAAAVIGNLTAAEVSALGRVGITKGHHFAANATAPNTTTT